MLCFFVSDLHGSRSRYQSLFSAIERERPSAVFLGGDLLPNAWGGASPAGFIADVLAFGLTRLLPVLGSRFPRVFLIPGNDDPASCDPELAAFEGEGLWVNLHSARHILGDHPVYGYGHVPPTPFQLKDRERYDVSQYVDPGAVSPEEGIRTVEVDPREIRWATIEKDLTRLVADDDLDRAIFLFHSPPYTTLLDHADLGGRTVDHVPLDVHIGSIAIRRFIEARQPMLTLHGHVHESARLTGSWRDQIGRTVMLSAAHDGPELALVRFDPSEPSAATRELL